MLTLLSHPAEESQERAGAVSLSNNIPSAAPDAANAGPRASDVSQAGARRGLRGKCLQSWPGCHPDCGVHIGDQGSHASHCSHCTKSFNVTLARANGPKCVIQRITSRTS